MRKPVFRVSGQEEEGLYCLLRSYCAAGLRLCAFVSAYAKSRFSHDMAHFTWLQIPEDRFSLVVARRKTE